MRRIRDHLAVRTFGLTGPQFALFAVGVVVWGVVCAYCFNLVQAFVFQDVLNASVAGDASLLVRGVILGLGAFVIGLPLGGLAMYASWFAVYRSQRRVRERLFDRLVRIPVARLDEKHSGDYLSRCSIDVDATFTMLGSLSDVSTGLFIGSIGTAAAFAMEWRLGFAGLGIGLAILGVSIPTARVLRRRGDALQKSVGNMTERFSDLVNGNHVARMFGRTALINDRHAAATADVAARKTEQERTEAAFGAAWEMLKWALSFGLLSLGLLFYRQGLLLIGAVWAIVHVQGNASMLFQSLGQWITGIQKGLAGGARVFELLDEPDETLGGPGSAVTSPVGHPAAVEVRDLAFRYGDASPALRGVSLAAAEGDLVALVGPSGGGKSTLVKLLLGFYPDYEGQVLLGGRDVRSLRLSDLRSLAAYVPQDAYLFDGTIEENIAMGHPGASHEQIVAAARAAHAHEFILEQPERYQTRVGERGARLSGGQRQRIAIARAVLKDAPILLLDEATSALDSESQALVQDALQKLMRGRTTIAVAHRLSTVEHADRIYVLDGGCIVEQGTHAELLDTGGVYASLQFAQQEPAGVA